MAELTVILDDLDLKALSYDCYDPKEWVDNCKLALKENAVDAILKKIASNKNKIARDIIDGKIQADVSNVSIPLGKVVEQMGLDIIDSMVNNATFETAKEKTDKAEKELS